MPTDTPTPSDLVEQLEKTSAERRLLQHLLLTQVLEHFPHGEQVPISLVGRLVDVACDQTGRWYAQFLCSPNGNRNEVAREEAELWVGTWLQWSELVWRTQPDVQALDEDMLDNGGILEVTLINIEDWKKRPVRKVTRWISGGLARVFHNAGIRSVSRSLGNIAMFPPGSFGRHNEVVMPTSLAASVRERRHRGQHQEPQPVAEPATVANPAEELEKAATKGDVERMRQLLDAGANVNGPLPGFHTPLMAASANGHDPVVHLLASKGADLLARAPSGETALHYASFAGKPSTVDLLLSHGANPNARDNHQRPPFFHTVVIQNVEVLRHWLGLGVDIETRTEHDQTLLAYSAAVDRLEIVKVAIDAGANLETRDDRGSTPLLFALMASRQAVAEYLLERGSDIGATDAAGSGALHCAAHGGLVGMCERLLKAGLDPNAQNSGGRSPLHVAVQRGFPTVERILIEGGGNIELRDCTGISVRELRIQSAPAFRLTERMRYLKALPEEIALVDGNRLLELWDAEAAAVSADDKESAWQRTRALLEDFSFAYRRDPNYREGHRMMSTRTMLAAGSDHTGETL